MKSMSDPVKSSEIEDVLASIRRLVSEEARGEMQARRQSVTQPQKQPEAVDRPEENTPVAEALVLTPALRVHEGGRATSEAQDAPREEAGDQTAEEFAEAVVADVAAELAEDSHTDHLDQDVVEEDAIAEAIAEAEDDLPEPPAEPQTLETKIAALEALIADNSDAWQPDTDLAEEAPEREQADASEPEDADLHSATEDAPDLVDSGESALDWEDHLPEPAEDSTDHAEEPEPESAEVVAEPADHVEDAVTEASEFDEDPDQSDDFADAEPETPEDTSDLSDDYADGQSHAENGTSVEASEEARLSEAADALTIDEDTLREMVVDIVREELQGALGERITRNVRRLVRREIHRALASQELD